MTESEVLFNICAFANSDARRMCARHWVIALGSCMALKLRVGQMLHCMNAETPATTWLIGGMGQVMEKTMNKIERSHKSRCRAGELAPWSSCVAKDPEARPEVTELHLQDPSGHLVLAGSCS